jgi:hypothetical protein
LWYYTYLINISTAGVGRTPMHTPPLHSQV